MLNCPFLIAFKAYNGVAARVANSNPVNPYLCAKYDFSPSRTLDLLENDIFASRENIMVWYEKKQKVVRADFYERGRESGDLKRHLGKKQC